MRITRFFAGMTLVTGLLLGACSSEAPAPEAAPEIEVAIESAPAEAATAALEDVAEEVVEEVAVQVPEVPETIVPEWPQLDETVGMVTEAIELFDAGNFDAMSEIIADLSPRLSQIATEAPTHGVSNSARLQAVQADLLEAIRPLEKGDDSPPEAVAVLREIAPLLQKLYDVADVFPPDDLM